MKRTTAEGNDSNRYTEGNPALGIPATVVGAEEMNNIQEELCNVVEDAGITLNGLVETQVLAAIKTIIQRGGTQIDQAITNNAGATSITGLIFDKTLVKAARVLFQIYREDATPKVRNEIGTLWIWHNANDDSWHIELSSNGEDAEVTFSITATGQVQYASSNFTGGSYVGEIRLTNITTLAQ